MSVPTPTPTPPPTHTPTIQQMAEEMIAVGVRRVHVLGWRDLDDEEAGGSEVHADQFMRRWAAAGLEVTHRTSCAAGKPAEAVRNGYRVIRRGSRYSVFARTMASEVAHRMGRYDALVEIWNGVPWMGPLWCRKPRITFLHHIHGPMWDQIMPHPLAGLGRLMETRLTPPFYWRGMTLTPSDATRDELLEIGFHADRVIAVPNGTDESFQPGGERAAVPTVVCVGRLAPVKRQDRMVEAAVVARRTVPDLQVIFVGDGPLRGRMEELISLHGAADWITLAGYRTPTQLIDLYRNAWVVASASLAEGWGLTLTEAAGCGTPAVATDINGHRSSIVDGVTGVLADVDHLGDALVRVLTDAELRDRLGAAALARVRTLTWEASATGVLAGLHGQVMARASARGRLASPQ